MPHSFYQRLASGDPRAFAEARHLALRVRSGAASPEESAAYVALYEIHESAGQQVRSSAFGADRRTGGQADIHPATLARLSGTIDRARGAMTMSQRQAEVGRRGGGGGGHHGGWGGGGGHHGPHHGGGGGGLNPYWGGWGGGWGWGWGYPSYVAAARPCVWSPTLGRYFCYVAGYGWMPV